MKNIFQQGLNEWSETVLDIVQRCVPELAAVPVYVARCRMANLRGASGPGFDEMFLTEIAASGKYDGRGECVVVDDAATYQTHFAAGTSAGMTVEEGDSFSKRATAGLIIHELSHAIRDDELGTSEPIGGDGPDAAQDGFEWWANTPRTATAEATAACPFSKHNALWIRMAAHLTARAAKFIPHLQISDVIDNSLYELSPARIYAAALGRELTASGSGSIRRVVFAAAPEPFVTLWKEDVAGWYRGLPSPTAEQERAAMDGMAHVAARQSDGQRIPAPLSIPQESVAVRV